MTPFYLSFQDEAQALSVLYTDGQPNYQNIDILGTVYLPAPDPLPEDYVPVPYPAPNYGVNVLVVDGEDSAPLQAYAVQPSPFPQRVWSI
jgi:hypothetical protein